jgi:hypothetical protein
MQMMAGLGPVLTYTTESCVFETVPTLVTVLCSAAGSIKGLGFNFECCTVRYRIPVQQIADPTQACGEAFAAVADQWGSDQQDP